MPIHFKFKFGEETRRSSFPEPPNWVSLSTKLQAAFALPNHNVAVSYVDSEDDEIIMSSEEELQDYYLTYPVTPAQVIKLGVVDLSVRRSRGGASSTPKVPLFRDLDDDWQRLPPFRPPHEVFPPFVNPADNFHAFIEVLDSDADTVKDLDDVQEPAAEEQLAQGQPPLDKGKQRAAPSHTTSTQSVVDSEAPIKHDIHVLNRSSSFDGGLEYLDAPDTQQDDKKAQEDSSDPPLPDFAAPAPTTVPTATTPISLTEDIATLITAFSNVVTAHPNLSTHVHKIVDNARRGVYWEAHREALARSVDEFSASVGATSEEFRRNAEAEAARRISDSLGGLFRSLSVATASDAGASSALRAPADPAEAEPSSSDTPSSSKCVNNTVSEPSAPHVSTSMPGALNDASREEQPSAPPKGPSQFSAGPSRHSSKGKMNEPNIWSPSSKPSWLPPPRAPIDHNISQSSEDSQSKMSPQELRASVEAAKAQYKAEKAKYRKEREERKQQRQMEKQKSGSGSDSAFKKSSHPRDEQGPHLYRATTTLVSNARGPFPRLEMVSIPPRRHHTIVGGSGWSSEDARSYARIIRKLADMGFTEASHPALPAKVKSRLSNGITMTKSEEDDIITAIMEELLLPGVVQGVESEAVA